MLPRRFPLRFRHGGGSEQGYIFVSSAVGASLVLYDPEQGFHQLLIQEPSITQAFDTYIRGMRDHGEVYSREETEAIVRKYRDGLKDGGTVAGTP